MSVKVGMLMWHFQATEYIDSMSPSKTIKLMKISTLLCRFWGYHARWYIDDAQL